MRPLKPMKKQLALGIVLLGLTSPVFAADKKVEAEVAEIRRILDAQSVNLATAMAQVQEMVSEFQKFTGTVDQNSHGTQQQSKILEDNQRRMDVMEEKLARLTTQLEEIKSAGLLSQAASTKLTEFKTYQAAVSKVNGSDFKGAISSLEAFIKANPKSQFNDAAQYWIAESYFAMRDFPKSISEFQKVITAYAKSDKVAAAMLKQGIAFYEMQSLDDAKVFLNKLLSKFPASSEAIKAQSKLVDIDQIFQARAVEAVDKKSAM